MLHYGCIHELAYQTHIISDVWVSDGELDQFTYKSLIISDIVESFSFHVKLELAINRSDCRLAISELSLL